jgi:hypothetical protein
MQDGDFGYAFIDALVERCAAALALAERRGADGGPWLRLTGPTDPGLDAGFVRLWAGEDPVDRMVQARLRGDPADTQLFFLFARPASVLPHFHAQVVQFGADACIYNADLIPRLDPVDHPDYYRQVFGPITMAYWKATQGKGNACASAPGNPAIAAYLSPWSIGAARPTNAEELARVGEQIHAYLDHWLSLCRELAYPAPAAGQMRQRDQRHLACFFDERLDPRAWKGVYRLLGEEQGHAVRSALMQNLHE